MPLPPSLARWLGTCGHDAVHAIDLNLDRAADAEIITRAVQEQRVIVTADLDYPRLLSLGQRSQPGLILFRGGYWAEADLLERMDAVLRAVQPADIMSSIIVVDRGRIRRRKLPVG
jgi:predicted nuclease of predicted toxin-antitoxin system